MTSERQPRGAARVRPTLKQVAALAGVSTSTASLVFSGKGPVADDTARRVEAAARQLGYAGPNPLAASLRQGRAGVIGVSITAPLRFAFQDPFAVAVLDGISTVVGEHGFGLLLVSATVPASQALDAMIVPLCGPVDDELVQRLVARGTPMVGTALPDVPQAVHLTIDDRAQTAALVRLLRALGHERLGHVAMELAPGGVTRPIAPDDLAGAVYPDTVARARGFLDEAPVGAPMVSVGSASVDAAARAAAMLLDAAEPPTAIVAQSDLIAAGVLQAAAERGLRVPDDLSVTGFDGVDLPWLGVALTTVDQRGRAKGRQLAQMAIGMVEGREVASMAWETRVVRGASVGRPKKG